MAYLRPEDPEILEDISSRKEFAAFRTREVVRDSSVRNLYDLRDIIFRDKRLRFTNQQHLIGNFMNVNTPYMRILMKWRTGAGKTLGALFIAMGFIQHFKLRGTGTVFVIGFSERVFKDELLRRPDLGFISHDELAALNKQRTLAAANPEENAKLVDMLTRFKKRISNRKGNGLFKFIGYKALANRLFVARDGSRLKESTQISVAKLASGDIRADQTILEKFEGGLLICDEIHNVYNSLEKNNWGIALQYIVDHVKILKVVYLSATPLNNSPTEIVDLINLLTSKGVNRADFFTRATRWPDQAVGTDGDRLKPGALERIGALLRGHVSFLSDTTEAYPSKAFVGTSITGIDYLKFIRCPMSPLHYQTYLHAISDKAAVGPIEVSRTTASSDQESAEDTPDVQDVDAALPYDSQCINDFVMPNPDRKSDIGLFQSSTIRLIDSASAAWKADNKVDFVDGAIVGDIAMIGNLRKYSTKYAVMLDKLGELLSRGDPGKIFIYHNNVHMSGVLFIREVLIKNGFIEETGIPTRDTLCVICGQSRARHPDIRPRGGDAGSDIRITQDGARNQIMIGDARIVEFLTNPSDRSEVLIRPWTTNKLAAALGLLRDRRAIFEISDPSDEPIADELERCGFVRMVDTILVREPTIRGGIVDDSMRRLLHSAGLYKDDECAGDNCTTGGSASSDGRRQPPSDDRKQPPSDGRRQPPSDDRKQLAAHMFVPARFIVAHSEIPRTIMHGAIDRFNLPSNNMGHECLILVGSKIVKESYNFREVQHIYVMSRPVNISTLIQIIGRGVRQGSHQSLPAARRHVAVSLFVSSTPRRGVLSYEESRYASKIDAYKVIQEIERVMHMNAIDATSLRAQQDTFDILPFTPVVETSGPRPITGIGPRPITGRIDVRDIKLDTFYAFHAAHEITTLMYVIKRIFIEVSSVWRYDDLFAHAKHPSFVVEFDLEMLDESLFIIALTKLLWTEGTSIYRASDGVVDALFSTDKIIVVPSKPPMKMVIVQAGEFYVLVPIEGDMPVIHADCFLRLDHPPEGSRIFIRESLTDMSTSLFDFETKRDQFYYRWAGTILANLEPAICDYGLEFHAQFIEEVIAYIFNLWTTARPVRSRMHEFYFKMLYYYKIRDLVMWVSDAKEFVATDYARYVTPADVKLIVEPRKPSTRDAKAAISTSGVINMLRSTLNNTLMHWFPDEAEKAYQAQLAQSLTLFSDRAAVASAPARKIPANMLPIGHFLRTVPRIYHPARGGWYDCPEYVELMKDFEENPIVIGYDEKTRAVHIRFKLRSPIQKAAQYKDARKIEKGSVCGSSKDKSYLINLAKRLGIKLKERNNVGSICSDIRMKLVHNELTERMNGTKIKWFYFSYEKQPIR